MDLILIDYFLGTVSGRELFHAIRARGVDAPVVFLTGLPACRAVLERHGEDIVVQSAPGQGSAFVFVLPCHSGARDGVTHTDSRTEILLNEAIS